MVVRFELKVNGDCNNESAWLHKGTLVLPDQTPEQKVLRAVRKTLKMTKGCCQLEKTGNGWNVHPAEVMVYGAITIAF